MGDPHFLGWYKHTQGHNGVLIDGHGQPFSDGAFGWIPRNIQGEQISYAVGDASYAYSGIVDGKEIDHGMKLFRRHYLMLRPSIIIIYDELEADHAAEKAIFEVIRQDYPDHFILSEETGEIIQDSSYKWIIDPIDGTINFANGIPICCVSIGVEKDGVMIMGAVYNPFMNELFFAEKGKGATLNDQKISVSDENN